MIVKTNSRLSWLRFAWFIHSDAMAEIKRLNSNGYTFTLAQRVRREARLIRNRALSKAIDRLMRWRYERSFGDFLEAEYRYGYQLGRDRERAINAETCRCAR